MTPDTGSLVVPLMHARPRSFKPARSLAATNPPNPLLPFDRPRRLRRHVVDHAVDALDLVDDGVAVAPNPVGCLAGRAVVETHDHGGVGNDDGIATLLGSNLEPAFDRGHGHRSVRQLLRDR